MILEIQLNVCTAEYICDHVSAVHAFQAIVAYGQLTQIWSFKAGRMTIDCPPSTCVFQKEVVSDI